MNTFIGWGVSVLFLFTGLGIPSGKAFAPSVIAKENKEHHSKQEPAKISTVEKSIDRLPQPNRPKQIINFAWGDISWLPDLAAQAGWPEHTWDQLGQIILRESGGCPNRRGGDAVDKNCNVTHVTEWNHRSDTGLLQINGVNYNPKRNQWAIACRQMDICTQEPLLDPLNNLKVGYLLYQSAGWDPWDPCAWGEEWAHRCKKKKD